MGGLLGAGAGRAAALAWASQKAGPETQASVQVPDRECEPREEREMQGGSGRRESQCEDVIRLTTAM